MSALPLSCPHCHGQVALNLISPPRREPVDGALEAAIALAYQHEYVSAEMIQRRTSVTLVRAKQILALLSDEGLVENVPSASRLSLIRQEPMPIRRPGRN